MICLFCKTLSLGTQKVASQRPEQSLHSTVWPGSVGRNPPSLERLCCFHVVLPEGVQTPLFPRWVMWEEGDGAPRVGISVRKSKTNIEHKDQSLPKKTLAGFLGLRNLLPPWSGCGVLMWATCAQASLLLCFCWPAVLLPLLSSLPEGFLSLNSGVKR